MPSVASINGNRVSEARVELRGWGVSYHDVTVDGSVALSGKVTLIVADLTIQGTILTGGPSAEAGASYFRIVAGAGGWSKTLPAKSYANDAGVKLATVLSDAANAVGETLDASTVDQSLRLGPAFVRPEGPAGRVLELLAPGAWYVGLDGVTRLGAQPATTLDAKVARTTELDLARGTVTLASETIANIVPGLVVDGLMAVDVEHEFGKDGLRSKIWGKQGTGQSRLLAAQRAIFDQLDPARKFRGFSEYRIVTQSGNRLNLQAVRASTGMPNLQRVPYRPGVPGANAQQKLGARVLVGFADADPSRPAVLAFEEPDGPGFLPQGATLDASGTLALGPSGAVAVGGPGGNPIARLGDQVTVFLPPTLSLVGSALIAGTPTPITGTIAVTNPISGIITAGSAKHTST